MQPTRTDLLTTRKHFEILDGLRGVAALAVVTFHFMEVAVTDPANNFIAHGFLAVDFFFCLSGFVIAYAYDNRIAQMGVAEFFKSRLIRLHPLVVLGSVLGLLTFLFDPFGGHPEVYSGGKVLLLFLCSVLLVPFPAMSERYFNLFGLNAPSWSLFWEYVANIVYAFILCRLSRKWLLFLVLVSAVLLCLVAFHARSLLGGWDGKSFWDGGARVFYSFLAGMMIYRFRLSIKNRMGLAGPAIMLLLAFLMPFNIRWNWLTEPLVVMGYFPLVIILGAGASLKPRVKKICQFLGQLSYPLYMTHYTFIWMFAHYYAANKPDNHRLAIIVVKSLFLLTGFAIVVMLMYDNPVRRFLTRKRLRSALNSSNE